MEEQKKLKTNMTDSSEFQVVKRQRKCGKKTGRNVTKITNESQLKVREEDLFDDAAFKKRLRDYTQELRLAEFLQDCVEYLKSVNVHQNEKQCTDQLDKKDSQHQKLSLESWPHLLSYGIGRFISCPIARYQLAFLLVLREKLNSPSCHVYDPVFSSIEKDVLKDLSCTVISHNEEGKRVCDSPTILFMPHCGKALYNNVIWANLDTLDNLIIIGNSFSRMLESTPHRILMKTAKYVIKIAPYMVERPLKLSSFVHTDVFNDLSVHTFPMSKLKSLPAEFWENNTEPVYDEEEVEFIRKEVCDA